MSDNEDWETFADNLVDENNINEPIVDETHEVTNTDNLLSFVDNLIENTHIDESSKIVKLDNETNIPENNELNFKINFTDNGYILNYSDEDYQRMEHPILNSFEQTFYKYFNNKSILNSEEIKLNMDKWYILGIYYWITNNKTFILEDYLLESLKNIIQNINLKDKYIEINSHGIFKISDQELIKEFNKNKKSSKKLILEGRIKIKRIYEKITNLYKSINLSSFLKINDIETHIWYLLFLFTQIKNLSIKQYHSLCLHILKVIKLVDVKSKEYDFLQNLYEKFNSFFKSDKLKEVISISEIIYKNELIIPIKNKNISFRPGQREQIDCYEKIVNKYFNKTKNLELSQLFIRVGPAMGKTTLLRYLLWNIAIQNNKYKLKSKMAVVLMVPSAAVATQVAEGIVDKSSKAPVVWTINYIKNEFKYSVIVHHGRGCAQERRGRKKILKYSHKYDDERSRNFSELYKKITLTTGYEQPDVLITASSLCLKEIYDNLDVRLLIWDEWLAKPNDKSTIETLSIPIPRVVLSYNTPDKLDDYSHLLSLDKYETNIVNDPGLNTRSLVNMVYKNKLYHPIQNASYEEWVSVINKFNSNPLFLRFYSPKILYNLMKNINQLDEDFVFDLKYNNLNSEQYLYIVQKFLLKTINLEKSVISKLSKVDISEEYDKLTNLNPDLYIIVGDIIEIIFEMLKNPISLEKIDLIKKKKLHELNKTKTNLQISKDGEKDEMTLLTIEQELNNINNKITSGEIEIVGQFGIIKINDEWLHKYSKLPFKTLSVILSGAILSFENINLKDAFNSVISRTSATRFHPQSHLYGLNIVNCTCVKIIGNPSFDGFLQGSGRCGRDGREGYVLVTEETKNIFIENIEFDLDKINNNFNQIIN